MVEMDSYQHFLVDIRLCIVIVDGTGRLEAGKHQFVGMILKKEFVNLTEGTQSAVFSAHAGGNPVLEVQDIGGVRQWGVIFLLEIVINEVLFVGKLNRFVVVCGLVYNRR
jgi:hypothetical protein